MKLQVLLFIMAVPLNLIWEVVQISAYDFPESSLMKNTIGCFVPSLGDGLITLMIYWVGWLFFRESQWILYPGRKGYILMTSMGLMLAVIVEWNALYRTGAWAYNEKMMTVPILKSWSFTGPSDDNSAPCCCLTPSMVVERPEAKRLLMILGKEELQWRN